jgi:hypothetical protein
MSYRNVPGLRGRFRQVNRRARTRADGEAADCLTSAELQDSRVNVGSRTALAEICVSRKSRTLISRLLAATRYWYRPDARRSRGAGENRSRRIHPIVQGRGLISGAGRFVVLNPCPHERFQKLGR